MNRIVVIAVLAAVAIAIWIQRGPGGRPGDEPRRAAFALPEATSPERAAYFFDLLESARSWRVGDWGAPVGRVIGKAGLIDGGEASLDYLLAEERYPDYVRSPNRLMALLALLEDFPRYREHPRTEPFLRHWLDPVHCPPDTPGFRPAEEFRKRIFHLFRVHPPAWAVPYCVEELTRANRHHDLRVEALGVLLYLGRTEPIAAHWSQLPPTPDEAEPLLKPFVLGQMRIHAGENQPAERREGARRLAPLARRELESGDLYSRVSAASTLLRLGDESMVERLLAFSDEAKAAGDETVRWSALLLLVEDRAAPGVHERCLERLDGPVDATDFTYRTALKILAYGWIDEPGTREKLWAYVDVVRFGDLSPLQWLFRAPSERERIVALLREAIRGDDVDERIQAIRFSTHPRNPVPEVMPDLYDVAKSTPADRGRTRYLNALVAMDFQPVEALLQADLADDLAVLRRAAAANLLELDRDPGVAAVAERLANGDREMLGPIVARAQARGADGIRERLLPALLETLRTAPGEEERFQVLYALRCRGRLDGVEEGLMEAYRREPSRRVASAIRETLVELAYRGK